MRFATLFAALAFAATTAMAQERPRLDCSQAKDPKACEERVDKLRAAHAQAQKACQGTKGPERSECMRKQMCAQAADPKACDERTTRMKEAHDKARAACEGKQGDEARD